MDEQDEVALRIGRAVLAGAELEFQVRVLLGQLGEPQPLPRAMADQLKAIRRRTRTVAESVEVARWTREVDEVLKQRSALVHGSFTEFWEDEGTRPGFMAHKDFGEVSVELPELDALVARARAAVRDGEFIQARMFDGFIQFSEPHVGPNHDAVFVIAPPKCVNDLVSMEMHGSIENPRWVCPECGLIRVS